MVSLRTLSLEEEEKRQRLRKIRQREWILLGILLGIVLLIGANVMVVQVEGRSMEPSFHNGQKLLVWRTARRVSPYKPHDVIVFKAPNSELLIKRIAFVQDPLGGAGMPERIWTPDGDIPARLLLWTSGRIYFPGYRRNIRLAQAGIQVRKTIYVMGDNFVHSEDSRDFGPISPDVILGKVVFSLSPTRKQTHPGLSPRYHPSTASHSSPV